MTALICGSMAYDNIMVFEDRFKRHILPDKLDILNVSFLVPGMRREFGGCAGNIAYGLTQLGGRGLPMSTVGNDFGPYAERLEACAIDVRHITTIDDAFTAQAFIITDLDDNQITAFHPGAMNHSQVNRTTDVDGVTVAIVSPDGRDGMLQHARTLSESGVPFIFDPGQGMPMFDGEELKRFLEQATWVTVNDYEWELLSERTGFSTQDVLERVEALLVTKGGKGSVIHTRNGSLEVAAVQSSKVVDPTGCGDAYRAGLLYGLMNDMGWEVSGRIASLMGGIKITHPGTQNYRLVPGEIEDRYKESFGHSLR